MKVQRYLYGGSNVQQLEQRRSRLRSPQEVAAEAAAPYEAVAQVAGAVSEDLFEVHENRIKAENADDDATQSLNFSTAEASRKQIEALSEAENWAPEKYQEAMDEITTNMLGSGESISQRNRPEYLKNVEHQAAKWQLQTASNYNIKKFEQSVAKTDESLILSLRGRDFTLAKHTVNNAMQDGRYSEQEANEKLRQIDDVELGYKLFEDYKKAVEAGTEAEFMAGMSEKTFQPDTLNTFSQEKNLLDSQMSLKKAEADAKDKLRNDLATVNVWRGIRTEELGDNYEATWTNERLDQIGTSLGWSVSQRKEMEGIRDKRIADAMDAGKVPRGDGTIVPDKLSQGYRDDISSDAMAFFESTGQAVYDPTSKQYTTQPSMSTIVLWEFEHAKDYNAVGSNLQNFLGNTMYESPEDFTLGVDYINRLVDMGGVILDGITNESLAAAETVRTSYGITASGQITNTEAANRIYTMRYEATDAQLSDAKQYANDQTIAAVIDTIMDSEDLMEIAGLMRNEWIDEEPIISQAMEYDMRDLITELATYAALENPRLNLQKLATSGARIFGGQTSVVGYNEGKPTGGMTYMSNEGKLVEQDRYGMEIERFPIIPDDSEIPWLHSVMEKDLVGKQFYHQGSLKTVVGKRAEPVGERLEGDTLPPLAQFPEVYTSDEIPYTDLAINAPAHPRNQFTRGQRVWQLSYKGEPILEPEMKGPYLFTPYSSVADAKAMFDKYTPVEGKASKKNEF